MRDHLVALGIPAQQVVKKRGTGYYEADFYVRPDLGEPLTDRHAIQPASYYADLIRARLPNAHIHHANDWDTAWRDAPQSVRYEALVVFSLNGKSTPTSEPVGTARIEQSALPSVSGGEVKPHYALGQALRIPGTCHTLPVSRTKTFTEHYVDPDTELEISRNTFYYGFKPDLTFSSGGEYTLWRSEADLLKDNRDIAEENIPPFDGILHPTTPIVKMSDFVPPGNVAHSISQMTASDNQPSEEFMNPTHLQLIDYICKGIDPMTTFVEFQTPEGKRWINPDAVISIMENGDCFKVYTAKTDHIINKAQLDLLLSAVTVISLDAPNPASATNDAHRDAPNDPAPDPDASGASEPPDDGDVNLPSPSGRGVGGEGIPNGAWTTLDALFAAARFRTDLKLSDIAIAQLAGITGFGGIDSWKKMFPSQEAALRIIESAWNRLQDAPAPQNGQKTDAPPTDAPASEKTPQSADDAQSPDVVDGGVGMAYMPSELLPASESASELPDASPARLSKSQVTALYSWAVHQLNLSPLEVLDALQATDRESPIVSPSDFAGNFDAARAACLAHHYEYDQERILTLPTFPAIARKDWETVKSLALAFCREYIPF